MHVQGQNMIVGMGDTGVDVFQCFFVDSSFPATAFSSGLLIEPVTKVPYFDSTTHRKVRYYRALVDNVDQNGHGTHCAGSALGYPETGEHLPTLCQNLPVLSAWKVLL